MRYFKYNFLFHLFFSTFLIALPFSKGATSIAYVALLGLSIFYFLKNKLTASSGQEMGASDNASLRRVQQILLAPGLLFLFLSISVVYSQNQEEGVLELITQSRMIGIPLIVYANLLLIKKRYYGYINMLIRAVSIAVAITFILFLMPSTWVQYITSYIGSMQEYIPHEKEHVFGAYSPFIDRLQFSYLIVLAIFLELWNIFHLASPDRLFYFFKRSSLIILLIGISILGARGAQLALLVSLGVWLIGAFYEYGRPWISVRIGAVGAYIALIISLFLVLIAMPMLAYHTVPAIQKRYQQMNWELGTFKDGTFRNYEYIHFTSVRRLVSWKNNWQLIKEQPFLGVGIGDYQVRMEQIYEKEQLGFPVNTHNQFLYYWGSAGLLGLISFIASLLFWGYHCMQNGNYWTGILAASLLIFYSLVFLLDAPLNYQVGAMTFWLGFTLISVPLFERVLFKNVIGGY